LSSSGPIAIISPRSTFEELREETERAVLDLLASGDYILGHQVAAFEREVGAYLGGAHAVGVSSGTEALLVALQCLGIGPGDEVITTPFTFIATATSVARLGARPTFVDIDPRTFQMNPAGVVDALTPRTKAILCVHLYGYPAPLEEYLKASRESGRAIPLLEDAAQALGTVCQVHGKPIKAGTVGLWGTFSFYPTKNLPACGEAGLMVTSDPAQADRARQLRNHGQDAPYRHQLLGGNARLDGIQAAILRVRLPRLEAWNARRQANAALYGKLFRESGLLSRGLILPPEPRRGEAGNHHQYTLRLPRREELKTFLLERQIQTGVYYPIPVPLQPVFAGLGYKPGDFPEAEKAAREVLSLPVHPSLLPGDIERVAAAVVDFFKR